MRNKMHTTQLPDWVKKGSGVVHLDEVDKITEIDIALLRYLESGGREPDKQSGPAPLNLYLVTRRDRGGYDTYDSFVCAAADPVAAIDTHPRHGRKGEYDWDVWDYEWSHDLDCTCIGVADPGVEAGVICASFNAG